MADRLGSLETKIMKKLILAAILSSSALFSGLTLSAHAADTVPCEDMLQTTRDALTAATTLAAADKTAIDALIVKGTERCNADDDKRADGFFGDAMKLMGK
jgi:hypothetical protein